MEGCVFYGDNSGEEHFVGYGTYLFKKNPDSKLGVTLVYSEFEQKKNINLAVSAKASSTLDGQVGKTYQASHLLDGNLNTCWVEGVKGTGEGETVTLDLPIMTDKLVITILDAVKGEKWEDTCISEIRVF